jgi:hypothetical protein
VGLFYANVFDEESGGMLDPVRFRYRDRLIVRLKSATADKASDCADNRSLTIPWQKPPSKRSRQILLPYNASRSDVRPNSSSVGRAWSAPSREVVGGSRTLSQIE